MEKINFNQIEKKWQKKWEEAKIFEAKEESKKPKFYCLEMFPYPSGSGLHIGHAWNYIIGDIISRHMLMKGFNVLHPMGFDSFGLPAENAAIKAKTTPEEYTKKSINNFIKQQKEIGLSYDWTRLLITSSPEYYKWDQWIFLQMFKKGLVYQKTTAVNWCPKCSTVLANEQVVNGKCWRHEDTNVEIKHLNQWFLKITNYADELYEGISLLKNWPEKTKSAQRNWIGKSKGIEIDFLVNNEKWPVFTTRPDTIFGVTFVVVSAQHKKLQSLITDEQKKEVENFLKEIKSVSEKELKNLEKKGVFSGSYAINPITKEKVPIYIGNFVVADYGSGMVMAVPAHDKRDYQFAIKYNLPIKQVISGGDISSTAYIGKGKLINSGIFTGLNNDEAKEKITEYLEEKKLGRKVINFKLRDWGISRQRYWGTPIPIIHCESCGAIPVPEEDLPIKLPEKVNFGSGNPLKTNEKWIKTKCPKCGKDALRETDTMDTFVNSSWYFLRYCDPKNNEKIFDKNKIEKWCPIDLYIGGAEHACMHLIYSRFYIKFLRDLGLINFDEPAKKLFHQGMVHGEDGNKMSKSKGNGILPEEISKKYGMDTARFFLSSLASPDKDINWSEKGIIGSNRFILKIFNFYEKFKEKNDSTKIITKLNNSIKNIGNYYENLEYRKATIELRELFEIMENEGCSKRTASIFLKLLNPICPHITEELWEKIGKQGLISNSSWPDYNPEKLNINKEQKDLNEIVANYVLKLTNKLNENFKKIYLYFLPFEINKIDLNKLKEKIGKEIIIYSVKDKEKYDPLNKSKKAKPSKPGVYFEK